MDQFPILAQLLDNNEKWASTVTAKDEEWFPNSANNDQRPPVSTIQTLILWIGCADSRVPESVIFASMPGEIFATRNIANLVRLDDDSVLSVLSFAIESLQVQHIIVAGHSACGGANTCLNTALEAVRNNTTPPAPTSPLSRWLQPLTDLAMDVVNSQPFKEEWKTMRLHEDDICDGELARLRMQLVEENVRFGVRKVLSSETLQRLWGDANTNSSLKGVHGVVYHLETGRVRDLKISVIRPGM